MNMYLIHLRSLNEYGGDGTLEHSHPNTHTHAEFLSWTGAQGLRPTAPGEPVSWCPTGSVRASAAGPQLQSAYAIAKRKWDLTAVD